MSDRNIVILFFAFLLVAMAFYGLGLLLGRTDLERTGVAASTLQTPPRRPQAGAADLRNELEFINTVSPKPQPARASVSTPEGGKAAGGERRSVQEVFTVQLGAFERKEEAERVFQALAREGYSPRVVAPSDNSGAVRFLVWAGRYTDRAEAETAARQLAKSGFPGLVRSQPLQAGE